MTGKRVTCWTGITLRSETNGEGTVLLAVLDHSIRRSLGKFVLCLQTGYVVAERSIAQTSRKTSGFPILPKPTDIALINI